MTGVCVGWWWGGGGGKKKNNQQRQSIDHPTKCCTKDDRPTIIDSPLSRFLLLSIRANNKSIASLRIHACRN